MTNVQSLSEIVESNGKTVRENNLEKQHNIPVGSLVECVYSGLRLYVAGYGRDCDGTPLYHLTMHQDAINRQRPESLFPKDHAKQVEDMVVALKISKEAAIGLIAWNRGKQDGEVIWDAISENGLTVIKKPDEILI